MNKKDLSERDICTKFITPAIQKAGWDTHTQLREEVYITKGRIIVRGRMTTRAAGKRVDYILYYKPNIPIAIIEAKDNQHSIGDGMQQALNYAEMIDVPFVYSSNGDGFLAHDRTGQSEHLEQEISLSEFPSPKELWRRYCKFKGLTPEVEAIVAQDYYLESSPATSTRPGDVARSRSSDRTGSPARQRWRWQAGGPEESAGSGGSVTARWAGWTARTCSRLAEREPRRVGGDRVHRRDFGHAFAIRFLTGRRLRDSAMRSRPVSATPAPWSF